MAAHRYWRVVALEAYGAGDLELSCFHLLDASGARVDALATLAASTAPTSGVLANLQDDDLTTAARWAAPAVATLALSWDFGGSPADVFGMQVAGDSEVRALLLAKLQHSDDGVTWVDYFTAAGIPWPGNRQLQRVGRAYDMHLANVTSRMPFDGSILDSAGRVWSGPSGVYEAGVSGVARQFGADSQSLTSPRIAFGSSDFTVEMRVKLSATASAYAWLLTQDAIGAAGTRGFQFIYGPTEGSFLFSHEGGSGVPYSGPPTPAASVGGRFVTVVLQRRADVLTIAVDGVARHSALPPGFVMPDKGTTPLTIGSVFLSSAGVVDAPFVLDGLRITLGAARYTTDFLPSSDPFGGVNGLGVVRGRVASIDPLTAGGGPVITYGTPSIEQPTLLTVESGSIKDTASGVLGKGIGRVVGTVKEDGTPDAPVYRKVRLVREIDGLLVRELWSDPITGAYDFRYVDELQTYTVLSYDHTLNFRAVIADGLTLANGTVELMP